MQDPRSIGIVLVLVSVNYMHCSHIEATTERTRVEIPQFYDLGINETFADFCATHEDRQFQRKLAGSNVSDKPNRLPLEGRAFWDPFSRLWEYSLSGERGYWRYSAG